MTEAVHGERWYCCDLPPDKHMADLVSWEELDAGAREVYLAAAKTTLEALRDWAAKVQVTGDP